MRKTLKLSMLLLAMCGATQALASASFANRSLGAGVSFIKIVGESSLGTDWFVPISLEGGLYIDNGFEVFLRPQFFLAQATFGAPTPSGAGLVIGGGGQLGVRYLFLEESIRPYMGLHLSAIVLSRCPSTVPCSEMQTQAVAYPGAGVEVGSDFFVGESVSLGIRGLVDLYIQLNRPVMFGIGGGLYATTYF